MITGKLRGALYLGLDRTNIARLTAGEPILVPASRLAQLGLPPMTVVIHFGEKQADMLNEIAQRGEELVE
jgi:hypothetical protein